MMMAPPGPSGTRLPIGGTVRQVFERLWERRNDLLRTAIVPFAAGFILDAVMDGLAPPAQDDAASAHGSPSLGTGLLLASLAYHLVLLTIFAVSWHRIVLIGPSAVAGLGVNWGRREALFLGRTLMLALLAMVGTLPLLALSLAAPNSGGTALVGVICGGLLMVLTTRLSLIFPATAIDRPYSFAQSWRDTAGNGLRLVLIMLSIILALAIALLVFSALVWAGGLEARAPYAVRFVADAISFLYAAAELTMLSIAFERLSGAAPMPQRA